jgi:hypothetical protein
MSREDEERATDIRDVKAVHDQRRITLRDLVMAMIEDDPDLVGRIEMRLDEAARASPGPKSKWSAMEILTARLALVKLQELMLEDMAAEENR